jgi:hypothetical protein
MIIAARFRLLPLLVHHLGDRKAYCALAHKSRNSQGEVLPVVFNHIVRALTEREADANLTSKREVKE